MFSGSDLFTCLLIAVRTWNWTSVSSIWRLEINLCHWLWATIARLSFWVSRWQKIPQFYFWLPSCWDSGWQVDCKSGFVIINWKLCSIVSTASVCNSGGLIYPSCWTIKFQVVLPEGSKDPTVEIPFEVKQHLEVMFS